MCADGILADTAWDWGCAGCYGGSWGTRAATNLTVRDCIIHSTGTSNVRLKMGCYGATFTRCRMFDAGFRDRTYGHSIDAINAGAVVVEDSWLSGAPWRCALGRHDRCRDSGP